MLPDIHSGRIGVSSMLTVWGAGASKAEAVRTIAAYLPPGTAYRRRLSLLLRRDRRAPPARQERHPLRVHVEGVGGFSESA